MAHTLTSELHKYAKTHGDIQSQQIKVSLQPYESQKINLSDKSSVYDFLCKKSLLPKFIEECSVISIIVLSRILTDSNNGYKSFTVKVSGIKKPVYV